MSEDVKKCDGKCAGCTIQCGMVDEEVIMDFGKKIKGKVVDHDGFEHERRD